MRHGGPSGRSYPHLPRLLVIALATLLAPAGPTAGQLVPAGGPWLLAGDYRPPGVWPAPMVVLTHPEGGFLALWQQGADEGAHGTARVFGRRFGDSGPLAPVLDFGARTLADAAISPDGSLLLVGDGAVQRLRLDGEPLAPPWAYDDGRVDPGLERCSHCIGSRSLDAALAVDPSGEILVAWPVALRFLDPDVPLSQVSQLLVRRFDPEGRPQGGSQPIESGFRFDDAEVSALGGGAYLVTATWTASQFSEFPAGVRILVDADDTFHPMEVAASVWEVRTAVASGGRNLSAYTQGGYAYESTDGDCTAVLGLLADEAGDLGPGPIDLPRDRSDCQWQARVAASPDGFVVGWQTGRSTWWVPGPANNPFHGVSLRRFDVDGRPVGDPLDLRLGRDTFLPEPEDAALADLAYGHGRIAVLGVGPAGIWAALASPVPAGPCRPGTGHLCLGGVGGDRFRIDAAYLNPYAGDAPGRGFSHPLTADTGAFWFFAPGNLELLVKVLDGRSVNGRFWVLGGAATTVEWWVTVTDTAKGEQWGRSVAPYALETVADVAALPRPSTPADPGPTLPPGPGLVGTHEEVDLGGRYRLRVTWTDPGSDTSGVGRGTAVTGDTALFWFFHPANVELLVKVLDGRPVNGHAWVLWGSLTGVAFELEVEDTLGGTTRIYRNEPFHLGGGADTTAFQ